LNNLSAVYAENNLNNSNNNLNTVLQQLSSGSKINSGADDAAGLSLVDGLQANQQALTQSQTNAQEGAGMLQVADGALSQVTTLLNRAVTLATEAANGTLNASQDTAANQEYQSILSEISNIGSTTTYNGQQVFNSNTNIYTGDSSTSGSAIDDLNIRTLSSSNLGDTGGVMAYSNGASNTFIDLSKNGVNATAGDALVNGTSSLLVNYMAAGVGGAVVQKQTTISVGGATGFADTAQGMINAINAANLGVTASFTTAAQAGTQAVAAAGAGHSGDTGIEINGPGAGVGSGTTPGAVGTLAIAGGTDSQTDALTGSLSLKNASGANVTLQLGQAGVSDNMVNLAATLATDGFTVTNNLTGGATGNLVITTVNSNQSAITASSLQDTTAGTLTYTPSAAYYTVGVSTPAIGASGIADAATQQAASSTFTADTSGKGGIATISYSDAAGQSLSATDLTSQANAQAALTQLNTAITDVAGQDGYIGAQINTLKAVSSVLSTQSENLQAAQNAVQATDYAAAASNMSKYEILSQTGISALAQANSMQQEVTKLLQ
jgi:flagellin